MNDETLKVRYVVIWYNSQEVLEGTPGADLIEASYGDPSGVGAVKAVFDNGVWRLYCPCDSSSKALTVYVDTMVAQ